MDRNQVGSPSNHTSNDGILSGLLVRVCSSEDEQNDEQRLPAYKRGNAPSQVLVPEDRDWVYRGHSVMIPLLEQKGCLVQ